MAAVGFSRGAVTAALFTRMAEELGIMKPEQMVPVRNKDGLVERILPLGPPLVPPGKTPQVVGLFDPVATGALVHAWIASSQDATFLRIKAGGVMKGFSTTIVAMALLSFGLDTPAKEPDVTTGTAAIHDVVELVTQKCAAPATIQWNAHPKRSEFLRSGMIPLGDLDYRVNLLQIPELKEWVAAIRLHDDSRKVDDSYVLFTRSGYGPFEAAYVITRLPEDFPAGDQALQSVMQMQRSSTTDGVASFVLAETPFGRGLEMVVGGRVGSMCFPTSRFQYADTTQAGSIGISRFAIKNRDLIEYALVLPWPKGMPEAAAIREAQSQMDSFQRGLESVPR